MLITVNCLECDTVVDADSTRFGTQTPCPKCGETVDIPKAYMGPGVTLAGFELKDRLGKGGMGEVFLATQINMRRDIAVKVLPKRMTQDTEAVTRFLHEARVAAKLEHPNVVTIIDAGEDEGYYYIAMRYVKGKTLEQLLKEHRPMPEKQALGYTIKVLNALAFGWRHHKILHRDIKPANIMIDSYGEVKLLDMGLAKNLLEESNITLTGTILGTPYFMSPEQARSQSDLDFHSDMYSVGATLFYLLTGRPPFNADQAVTVMTQHLSEPPPDVRSLNPSVSAATAEALYKMLEKEPADRYASYEELIELFTEIVDDEIPMISNTGANVPTDAPPSQFVPITAGSSQQVPKSYRILALASILLIVFLAVAIALVKTSHKPSATPNDTAGNAPTPSPAPGTYGTEPTNDPGAELVKRKLLALEAMATSTPEQIVAARTRCRGLMGEYAGTPHQASFQKVWGNLNKTYGRMCAVQWQSVKEQAWVHFNAKREEAAIAMLETYSGPFKEGIAKNCAEQARAFRSVLLSRKEAELAKINAAERAKQKRQERLRRDFEASLSKAQVAVAKALIRQEFEAAISAYSALSSEKKYLEFEQTIAATFSGLSELCEINGIAMEAARSLKGQTVTWTIDGNPMKAVVSDVTGAEILVSEPNRYGSVSRKVSLRDISPNDRFKLMKAARPEVLNVMRGLLLLEMKELAKSRTALNDSTLPIADVILLTLGLDLKQSWHQLIATAKLPLEERDLGKIRREFDNRIYTDDEKQKIKAEANRFIKFFANRPDSRSHVSVARHMASANADFLLPKGFRPVDSARVNPKSYAKGAKESIALQHAFAAKNALTVEAISPTGIKFRLIPTGASWNFLSNPPNHPFYLSTHEVTAEVWKKVMGTYRFSVRKNMPAESITIGDAVTFLERLCKMEDLPKGSYRLPTGPEWIYACTAGTKARFYFGDNTDDLWKFANYLDRSAPDTYLNRPLQKLKDGRHTDKHAMTAPIGSYPCNPWGLHDMLGNVAEYVADGELKFAIGRGAVKGGSWLIDKRGCDVKTDHQLGQQMDRVVKAPSPIPVGFRIVRVLKKR